MEIKEWLSRGWGIASRIEELEREKKKLFEAAVGTVGHSDPDRVQVNYASAAAVIDREKEELIAVLAEITGLISKVENITFRRLLSMRYIEFMRWEDIAWEMYYNVRHIYKVHEKALIEANKILDDNYGDLH